MSIAQSVKLAVLLFGSALAFGGGRFNVGENAHGQQITCGGAVFSEQIKKNVLGQNPDVPVSLIGRYPMLQKHTKILSDIHVVCAVILVVFVFIQMALPKGNDAGWESSHVWRGRIISWGMTPHYVLVGLVLNYFAISMPVDDWKLAPGLSDWRMQTSYIIPFAFNTLVSMLMGFFLMKYSFMPQWTATPLKWLCMFNMVFWFTIGMYMSVSQAFNLGLGAFQYSAEEAIPGGSEDKEVQEKVQGFFWLLNILVVPLGSCQAGQDYLMYKCLERVEASGFTEIAWKDMHKLAMIDLTYQAGAIFGVFFAYIPWCLLGLPEWTCWTSFPFAVPVISIFLIPSMMHAGWLMNFIPALCGAPQKLTEFCKNNHTWDGPWSGPKGTAYLDLLNSKE